MSEEADVDEAVVEELREYFERNGYVRWPNWKRVDAEGWQQYKKGTELRMIAYTLEELRHIQSLLKRAGFRVSRPFRKGNHFRQPVYGHDAVERFLDLLY